MEMEGAAKNLSSVSKSVESMTGPGGKLELASTDLAEGLKQFRDILQAQTKV